MTLQASDVVIYRGEEYGLAASSGKGLFDPRQHGLKPETRRSDCWRGFICTYAVDHEQLSLRRLAIGLDHRVPIDQQPMLFGRRPATDSEWGCTYDSLSTPVPFSGGLMLCRECIRDSYIKVIFSWPYLYDEVLEVIFAQGRLVNVRDCTHAAKELGNQRTHDEFELWRGSDEERFDEWAKQTFALHYERG